MDQLTLELAIDDIAKQLLAGGLTPDQIRDTITEEAARVSSEIESGQWQ